MRNPRHHGRKYNNAFTRKYTTKIGILLKYRILKNYYSYTNIGKMENQREEPTVSKWLCLIFNVINSIT